MPHQALDTSEFNMRIMQQCLGEILFRLDESMGVLFLNPAWQKLTGYALEETLGTSLLKYFVAQDAQGLMAASFDCEHAPTQRQELRLHCRSGELRWVSVSFYKYSEASSGTMIFGTMIDIHAQKLMEEQRRSEELNEMASWSTTACGIWTWGLNNRTLYLSPRSKALLGYSDEQLQNHIAVWFSLIHPDDLNVATAKLMACLEDNQVYYQNICRMQHREGHWVWILATGTAVKDLTTGTCRLVCSYVDLSQFKAKELALQLRNQELDAVNAICPDGLVLVSKSGLISYVNPAFLQMLGFAEEKLLGLHELVFNNLLHKVSTDNASHVSKMHPGAAIYYLDYSKLRSHAFRSHRIDAMAAMPSPKAKIRTVSRIERALTGNDVAKAIYFRDISIETEVDQIKSQFLAIAAHELRAPMASVLGFSELLIAREYDRQTTHEILNTIHVQANSLVNMLNQLLDLARIESRMGLDFSFKCQPLKPIIERICKELVVPGDTRNVSLSLPKLDIWVKVDAEKLRLVISNVLVNAYKYSPKGGTISLGLRFKSATESQEAEVGIVIRDQGLGMTKAQLKHIFERFWRAEPNNNVSGAGLGLSLVKEIMDIHQGRIVFKSTPGEGTTVTLWLKQASNINTD